MEWMFWGASVLYSLGVTVRQLGRLEEAEELLRRCVGIWETRLGVGDVAFACA